MAFVSGFSLGSRPGTARLSKHMRERPVRSGRCAVSMATPKFQPGKMPKEKVKLDPEEVFVDVAPTPFEILIPFISLPTIIGIIPFIAAVARQLWVRYKITSRRISVSSGFQGQNTVEIVYADVDRVRYVRRLLGESGDMVLELRDGAKLEMRAVPKFQKVYDYIMSKVDADTRERSGFGQGKE